MHDVQSRTARWAIFACAMTASIVMLGVSMFANYRFGYTLGKTVEDGQVYGLAAAAGDILMAGAPFLFFAAIGKRAWLQAFSALVIFIITFTFATTSAIGNAASNRLEVTAAREVATTNYEDTREELKTARQQLGFIPQHRPLATVVAEIEKHKVNRIWSQSNECTDLNQWSRPYCVKFQELVAEKGNAMEAEKLRTRIDGLVSKSQGATGSVKTAPDPAAYVLSLLSGLASEKVQSLLILSIAAVVLGGASLGPYISMSMLGPMPERKIVTRYTQDGSRITEVKAEIIEPPKKMLALSAPRPKRDEPSQEAAELLVGIGMPTARMKGQLRSKDSRDVAAWRFMSWLVAHNLSGEYTGEALDELYSEFCGADFREPWASRIVKKEFNEDRALSKWVWSSLPRQADGTRATMWTIKCPPVSTIAQQLAKRGLLAAKPEPKERPPAGNILQFWRRKEA